MMGEDMGTLNDAWVVKFRREQDEMVRDLMGSSAVDEKKLYRTGHNLTGAYVNVYDNFEEIKKDREFMEKTKQDLLKVYDDKLKDMDSRIAYQETGMIQAARELDSLVDIEEKALNLKKRLDYITMNEQDRMHCQELLDHYNDKMNEIQTNLRYVYIPRIRSYGEELFNRKVLKEKIDTLKPNQD